MVNEHGKAIYRNQDIMGASPIRLIIMTYDVAILACEREDIKKAIDAVSLLRDSLNLDIHESSEGFLRLYQWCLECIRERDFSSAHGVLTELREAWISVEARGEASMPAPTLSRNLLVAAA